LINITDLLLPRNEVIVQTQLILLCRDVLGCFFVVKSNDLTKNAELAIFTLSTLNH